VLLLVGLAALLLLGLLAAAAAAFATLEISSSNSSMLPVGFKTANCRTTRRHEL
jgi:hypothetical protein